MNQPGQNKARSWEQGSGTVLSLALIALALLLSGVIALVAAAYSGAAKAQRPPWLVLKRLMIR